MSSLFRKLRCIVCRLLGPSVRERPGLSGWCRDCAEAFPPRPLEVVTIDPADPRTAPADESVNYPRISAEMPKVSFYRIGVQRPGHIDDGVGQRIEINETQLDQAIRFNPSPWLGRRTRRRVAGDIVRSLAPAFEPPADLRGIFEKGFPFPAPDTLQPAWDWTRPFNARLLFWPTKVVAWRYTSVNVGRYLDTIRPVYRPVVIDGITVVHPRRPGQPARMTRYVDWNSVMAQLGIVANQRPVMGSHPDDKGWVKAVGSEN